jgi:hypothetical protein
MGEPNFEKIMKSLTTLQMCFRGQESRITIVKRCPKFVRTQWFYLAYVMAFIVDNVQASHEFLEVQTGDQFVPDSIPA